MTISRNDAFAGRHVAPDGATIEVKHLSKARVYKTFPSNPAPGHSDHLRAGWYWKDTDGWAPNRYTSSRIAYQAAVAYHAAPSAPTTPQGGNGPIGNYVTEIKYASRTGRQGRVEFATEAADLVTALELALQQFRRSARGKSASKIDASTWATR